jgi:hypothetical protein
MRLSLNLFVPAQVWGGFPVLAPHKSNLIVWLIGVRYAPIATKFRNATKCRDVPEAVGRSLRAEIRDPWRTKRPRRNFPQALILPGAAASPLSRREAEEKAAYRAGTDSGRDL